MPNRRDFDALLNAEAVQDIFAHYRQHGGNRDNLRSLLELLWRSTQERDHGTVSPRTLKARLGKCEEALEKLLVVSLPSSLHEELHQAWKGIRRYQKSLQTEKSVVRLPSRPGRPELSLPTLVVAVLAREFRSRFGKPSYGDILSLVKAVAPKFFPPTITTEHLYQRARSLKANSAAKDLHGLFFSSSHL